MRPDDAPVLAVMREALRFYSERQKVTAGNVANANTPGFTPKDIPQSEFERALTRAAEGSVRAQGLTQTHPDHFGGAGAARRFSAGEAPDSETTINGNSVVLEEQMARSSENRMRFETVLGLYQKSLTLMRIAARGINN